MKRIASVVLLALAFAGTAAASRLDERAVVALEPIAGAGVSVDCNLDRPEALGHAYVPERTIGVRPWVCRRANAFVLRPARAYSTASYQQAFALLILTHEAVHLSDYSGADDEALTECRAIQLVHDVALGLGASDATARTIGHEAMRSDARLPGLGDYRVGLGLIPNYHPIGCRDDGPLDIHPDSHDWPN